jgi:hypothetical protein
MVGVKRSFGAEYCWIKGNILNMDDITIGLTRPANVNHAQLNN